MIVLSICVKKKKKKKVKIDNYLHGRLFWLISQISVQRNMVGYVVDGHIQARVLPLACHREVWLAQAFACICRYVHVHHAQGAVRTDFLGAI